MSETDRETKVKLALNQSRSSRERRGPSDFSSRALSVLRTRGVPCLVPSLQTWLLSLQPGESRHNHIFHLGLRGPLAKAKHFPSNSEATSERSERPPSACPTAHSSLGPGCRRCASSDHPALERSFFTSEATAQRTVHWWSCPLPRSRCEHGPDPTGTRWATCPGLLTSPQHS